MSDQGPVFPPLLHATSVDAAPGPFARAARLAHKEKAGAGDVLWSRSTSKAEMAIILEPDVPLAQAQQMAPLSMLAMGDALGGLCPPQVSVHFRWPRDILINGARAGGVTLMAPHCQADEVPRWLVVGMSLQIIHDNADVEPGKQLDRTCLVEEGIGADLTRNDIVQSLASYWMAGLNNWQDEGLAGCHDRWLFRAAGREEPIAITHDKTVYHGTVLGLDDEAGLLLKSQDDERVAHLSYGPYIMHLDDQDQDDPGL